MFSLAVLLGITHLISAYPGPQITVPPVVKRDGGCGISPSSDCFTGSWTHGPECTTDAFAISVVSDLENPPATETDYNSLEFCSAMIQQTSTLSTLVTYSATSTETDHTYIEHLVTTTDYDHPTSTVWCPSPSQCMVCGLQNHHTIYDTMREIWPQDDTEYFDLDTCHQRCLGDEACHSFYVDFAEGDELAYCALFGENLGANGTRAEPVTQVMVPPGAAGWYDRNCPEFLPTGCGPQPTLAPRAPAAIQANGLPRHPMVTAAARAEDKIAHLERRSTALPQYLSAKYAFAGGFFLSYGCSCVITSALPVATTSTTVSIPVWLGTVTTTSTYNDYFTVTETVRTTTVYPTIS